MTVREPPAPTSKGGGKVLKVSQGVGWKGTCLNSLIGVGSLALGMGGSED